MMGIHQLSRGNQLLTIDAFISSHFTEIWQSEVLVSYDALMSTHKSDITHYLSDNYAQSLNSTLQGICNSVIAACPCTYLYPASDLAPVGTEHQIRENQILQLPEDLPDNAGYEDHEL